jgi:hypothetical protein
MTPIAGIGVEYLETGCRALAAHQSNIHRAIIEKDCSIHLIV